jgi:hypothetical protein
MSKRHKPEEIVAKLRQVDVLVAQGKPVADAIRSIGVTEVTYYRWKQEGGLKIAMVCGDRRLPFSSALPPISTELPVSCTVAPWFASRGVV